MKVYTQDDIPERAKQKSVDVFTVLDGSEAEVIYYHFNSKQWYDYHGNTIRNNFKWIYPPKELLI